MDTVFVDFHLIGTSPADVKKATQALGRAVKQTLATEESDVVGKASKPVASETPFPEGFYQASTGAAFELNDSAQETVFSQLEKLLKSTAQHPNMRAAVAVSWRLNGESVYAISVNVQGQVDRRFTNDDDTMVEQLGMSYDEAVASDELVDLIGDRMLSFLLTPAPEAFAPLIAERLHDRMDQTLPAAPARRKPRV